MVFSLPLFISLKYVYLFAITYSFTKQSVKAKQTGKTNRYIIDLRQYVLLLYASASMIIPRIM